MDHLGLFLTALAFLLFALVTRKVEGSAVTGPMLFAAFGFAAGPGLLGLVDVGISDSALQFLAEITLILVLFSDAAKMDLKQLRRDHNLPLRMLLVGMPLSIALGTGSAFVLFPQISLWEAALLAAILTPTDAALGQAIVENEQVPVRIRQAINVESGLNDGIALPFVLLFATLAGAASGAGEAGPWFVFTAQQLGLAPVIGVSAGYAGAKLIASAYSSKRMTERAEGVGAVSLAILAFALAETLGSNGFIASFTAGLAFGNTMGRKCPFLYQFEDTEARILTLLTFAAVGAVLIPTGAPHLNAACVLFAVLALTLMRMLPVFVSLAGSGVRPATAALLGWFGPRGLASVLFLLVAVEMTDLPHERLIVAAVVGTVTLSIFLHGFSAAPISRSYAAMVQRMGECEESRPVARAPFS